MKSYIRSSLQEALEFVPAEVTGKLQYVWDISVAVTDTSSRRSAEESSLQGLPL